LKKITHLDVLSFNQNVESKLILACCVLLSAVVELLVWLKSDLSSCQFECCLKPPMQYNHPHSTNQAQAMR